MSQLTLFIMEAIKRSYTLLKYLKSKKAILDFQLLYLVFH